MSRAATTYQSMISNAHFNIHNNVCVCESMCVCVGTGNDQNGTSTNGGADVV